MNIILERQGSVNGEAAIPEANLGMVRAGIAALEECRRNGSAAKDNGDANVVYAVYAAMRARFIERKLSTNGEIVDGR